MSVNHVTEFSVLVPSDLAGHSREVMARFRAHLERQFPGYSFSIATFIRMVDSNAPVDIEDWLVVPCRGVVGDGAHVSLKPMPDRDLVREITLACKAYRFDGKSGLAA